MVRFALDAISGATAKDIENGSMLTDRLEEASRGQTALKILQPCSVLILDALPKTLFALIGILQFAYIVPSFEITLSFLALGVYSLSHLLGQE